MSETTSTTTTLSLETRAIIEEHIRHLLNIMGFTEAKVTCRTKTDRAANDDQPYLHVAIEAEDAGRLLIGSHGAHLNALQHIIRAVLRKQSTSVPRITVDVNGYRASRERSLLQLAQEAARKAGRNGRAITLPPMNAADRHLVHTSLAGLADIKTESLGQEPNRRVVVRPTFI